MKEMLGHFNLHFGVLLVKYDGLKTTTTSGPHSLTLGFYGKKTDDGEQFKQCHPFSNFHWEKIIITGIGEFRCSEALITLWKALLVGDGSVAYALATHPTLPGSVCKVLGRLIRMPPPPSLAVMMYVALVKWDQCPIFRTEMRRIHAKGFKTIHAFSNEGIWGTKSRIGDPLGPGRNILGKVLMQILKLV